MGIPAGVVFSSLIFLAVTSLSEEQFFSWGWRVPFLLSILLVAVRLFMRLRILESPAFRRIQESGTAVRIPLVDVFKNYWTQVSPASRASSCSRLSPCCRTAWGASPCS